MAPAPPVRRCLNPPAAHGIRRASAERTGDTRQGRIEVARASRGGRACGSRRRRSKEPVHLTTNDVPTSVTLARIEILGELSAWRIELRNGAALELWAHSYSQEGDDYRIDNLVRAPSEPASHVLVTARTPSDPSQLIIAVARIPRHEVASIRSL